MESGVSSWSALDAAVREGDSGGCEATPEADAELEEGVEEGLDLVTGVAAAAEVVGVGRVEGRPAEPLPRCWVVEEAEGRRPYRGGDADSAGALTTGLLLSMSERRTRGRDCCGGGRSGACVGRE